jgi:hypothetical protein
MHKALQHNRSLVELSGVNGVTALLRRNAWTMLQRKRRVCSRPLSLLCRHHPSFVLSCFRLFLLFLLRLFFLRCAWFLLPLLSLLYSLSLLSLCSLLCLLSSLLSSLFSPSLLFSSLFSLPRRCRVLPLTRGPFDPMPLCAVCHCNSCAARAASLQALYTVAGRGRFLHHVLPMRCSVAVHSCQ